MGYHANRINRVIYLKNIRCCKRDVYFIWRQSIQERKLAEWSDMCEYAIMEAVADKLINYLIDEVLEEFNNGS